ERRLVDQTTTGRIDKNCRPLHLLDASAADDISRRGGQRDMERYDVAIAQDVVEGGSLHVGLSYWIVIESLDLHSKCETKRRHGSSEGAESDQSKGRSCKIVHRTGEDAKLLRIGPLSGVDRFAVEIKTSP